MTKDQTIDCRAAQARIANHLRKTPLAMLEPGDVGVNHPAPIALKLEHLQRAGSFKARGAFNSLLRSKAPAAGVAAASGGNHGIAVAYAAKALGIKASIYLPASTTAAKADMLRSLGADVNIEGAVFAEALTLCESHCADTGAQQIHAYDQPGTVEGQGTLGHEILDQMPDVDTIMVSLGGGGLAAGTQQAINERGSGAKVIALETPRCNCYQAAAKASAPTAVKPGGLASDSLGASTVGDLAFGILDAAKVASVIVEEASIAKAQLDLWQQTRLAVDPAAALGLAALQTGAYQPQSGERIALVLCGGNIDPSGIGKI